MSLSDEIEQTEACGDMHSKDVREAVRELKARNNKIGIAIRGQASHKKVAQLYKQWQDQLLKDINEIFGEKLI